MTDASPPRRSPRFASTRWSLVVTAGGDGDDARTALGELAQGYAYPLYAFARRLGRSADDARDLVQSFFAELVEKGGIGRADPPDKITLVVET